MDKKKKLPWDYFLTNYERDLLNLPFEDALRKYSRVSRKQMESDLDELRRSILDRQRKASD